MARLFSKILREDMDLGIVTSTVDNPGGGTMTGHQINIGSFALDPHGTIYTWTPGSVSGGAQKSVAIQIVGVLVGQTFIIVEAQTVLNGLLLTGEATADNTVTVYLSNPTSGILSTADTIFDLRVLAFALEAL